MKIAQVKHKKRIWESEKNVIPWFLVTTSALLGRWKEILLFDKAYDLILESMWR